MFFGYPISTQDLRDLENMAIQVGGLKLGYIVENVILTIFDVI